MEDYEESEYSRYEDDFESPETNNIHSTKTTQADPPPTVINYTTKDLSYKKSTNSHQNSKSPIRQPSTPKPTKKTFQSLLIENNNLRTHLKKINEDLSSILSTFPKKVKSALKPTSHSNFHSTKLQVYINEYIVLQAKVQKIMDSEYLIKLRNEIKQKESQIEVIDKEIKKLKKAQKNRDKNLKKFWSEDLVQNELTHFGHMNNQLCNYREQIEKVEAVYAKDNENYLKLQEKELELSEKVQKLQDLWDVYCEKDEGVKDKDLKDRSDVAKKRLEMAKAKGQNRCSKLIGQEKTLNSELDSLQKERKGLQALIGIKEKEANQCMIELQEVALNVSLNDMGHLLSLVKIGESENTPITDSSFQTSSPKEQKKQNMNELLKIDTKKEETEEITNNTGTKPRYANKKIIENAARVNKHEMIEEMIPEEEESFQPTQSLSILKELEKNEEIQFVMPLEKQSIIKQLETKEANGLKPKSLFEELEESSLSQSFHKRTADYAPIPKVYEKSSFLTEIEDKAGFKDAKPESVFKPIEKSSFLMELESESTPVIAPFKPLPKPSFLKDLESDPVKEIKPDDYFKPINKNPAFDDHPLNKTEFKLIKPNEISFLSESEPKPSLSSKAKGRDRSHLFSKKEENDSSIPMDSSKHSDEAFKFQGKKKDPQGYLAGGILDKMKNMAERAEKHDFFGGLYDKKEEIAFTGKLLPTKFENSPNPTNVFPEPKPKKPVSKFFELEEEDTNL